MYKSGEQIRLTSNIRRYLSPEILLKIERTTRRYDLNNNQKGKIILNILKQHFANMDVGFRLLGKGTNRMGVQIDDLAFKIALDPDGHIDNKREFKYTNDLQPYVIKVYECTSDGLIAVTEFVQCFDDYDYMLQCADEIREILRKVSDEYFIGDVGITSKNAANWGRRRNGELVMLDFAYIYSVSYRLFTCTCDAQEILHYNADYTSLVCPACKRTIEFAQIRRRISKKDQDAEIGDLTKQAYILHNEVEYQKVNPEFSDVEETETEEEIEARRKRKMAKKIKNKNFDKRMEQVNDAEQIDLMTKLWMGQTPNNPMFELESDDEIGDAKAGEELMLKSLQSGGPLPDEGVDIDDVVDDPTNPNPVFGVDDYEAESPADLSPVDYAAMAAAMGRHIENNFGKNPIEEAAEEEMAEAEEVEGPSEEEIEDSVTEVGPSEDTGEETFEITEDVSPVPEKDAPEVNTGMTFPQISAINRLGKIIAFKVGMSNEFFTGPDIEKVKNAHTNGESHNKFISESSISDALMLMFAAITKPAIICNGEMMDNIIFPSDLEHAISIYNTKRFKIVELMGDREVAPGNPKKRFFAIYDVGNSVDFLNRVIDEFSDNYGDEAVSDYILAMLAQLRLKVEIGDLDYFPSSMINVWDTDDTSGLSTPEECIGFYMNMIQDPGTRMAENEDEIYTLSISSWGVDEHDSDIAIFEEIFDVMVPQIAETMQNYTGGYEGIGSVQIIKDVLTYSKFKNTNDIKVAPNPEKEEESDDYEDENPEDIEFPDSDMVIDTVQRPQ